MLPDRAVRIINEYSKPLTRPEWRQCKRMTQNIMFEELIELSSNINSINLNIFDKVLMYMRETPFYRDYMMCKLNNLKLNY